MVLVSWISNFFTNKTYLANKWMSFSSSDLALEMIDLFYENTYFQTYVLISNVLSAILQFNLFLMVASFLTEMSMRLKIM